MADQNIEPYAFVEKNNANDGIDKSTDQQYRPITNNILNGQVSGEVTFEFSTGQDEWLQMSKTYLVVDYDLDDGGNPFSWYTGDVVAPSLWSKAQFYIEGQRVSQSNNYTQDYMLSNRLQYSADFNKRVNNIRYKPTTVFSAGDTTIGAGGAIVPLAHMNWDGISVTVGGNGAAAVRTKSVDNLAALFLKLEGLVLPPNTHYRFTFSAENYEDFIQKTGLIETRAANRNGDLNIRNMYMNVHTIRRTERPVEDFTVRVVNVESNISSVNAQQFNQQYQVSHRMKKVGVVFQAFGHRTEAAAKVYATNYFTYDEARGILDSLQFKSGSLNLPNTIWNFRYGKRDAYMHYLHSTDKYNDRATPETEEEWERMGRIYIEDVVKGDADLSTNLQIEAAFSNANVVNNVYMITFQINENIIPFEWSGPDGLIPKFKFS